MNELQQQSVNAACTDILSRFKMFNPVIGDNITK